MLPGALQLCRLAPRETSAGCQSLPVPPLTPLAPGECVLWRGSRGGQCGDVLVGLALHDTLALAASLSPPPLVCNLGVGELMGVLGA
ncbi:hypothetical protein O3P69_014783 [Scylla paramamosain]|uniref:Uncharacterized protein n=1 Tax=Scylla paramamosain TaxID=85552 RepID=A0AAW0TZJ5_SCYPA